MATLFHIVSIEVVLLIMKRALTSKALLDMAAPFSDSCYKNDY